MDVALADWEPLAIQTSAAQLLRKDGYKGGCSLLVQEVRKTEANLAKQSLLRVLLCHLGGLFTLVASPQPACQGAIRPRAYVCAAARSGLQPGKHTSAAMNKLAEIRILPETWHRGLVSRAPAARLLCSRVGAQCPGTASLITAVSPLTWLKA